MLVGRQFEQNLLNEITRSDKSEFVAIYGRRRVGKTYLVRETFNYNFAFQHTGVQNGDKTRQLTEFERSLINAGMNKCPKLKDWFMAFDLLGELLQGVENEKKIVFIDEMPWLDTPKSDFLSTLEHFWNGWATMRRDIVLIVCGSATSWIVSKLVNNYGGLHNRLTRQIYLKPFTLHECELYANARELKMTRMQILQTYMVLGGVPYYWSFLRKGYSWAQNIDSLFFAENSDLKNEFDALYSSLFRYPDPYIKIVTALSKKKAGMTRGEIADALGQDHGGTLTKILKDLELCGFIRSYTSIGKAKKDTLYQLFDNFTLFYFRFIEGNSIKDQQFWSRSIGGNAFNVWSGLAFERICFQHVEQIKMALGISGVMSSVYSWVYRPISKEESGVQIDMLIDRNDGVIDLCEIKFSQGKYEIKKKYAEELRQKLAVFQSKTETRKSVFTVMITTEGLTNNEYAGDIQNEVVVNDLFS
ncbi:MAG: ATP-binding protein [Paludibacteraceae bacterium]|nr:ATP-binding protein [Paludibacteraceae bacterium]